jgi:protein-disulfide isomerase
MRPWLLILVTLSAVAGADETVLRVPIAGAPSRGPASATVTIVAFEDFHCPFCARAQATLEELERRYPDDVRVVFHHRVVHESAWLPAEAAVAAARQGRFWEMHDALFANIGGTRDREGVEGAARAAGLDLARFERDLDDPSARAAVAADDALGSQLGVDATPTFFVNGRELRGAQPIDVFVARVEAERARATAAIQAGAAPFGVYDALVKEGADHVAALDPSKRYDVPIGQSPIRGSSTAKVTIVEFADFECPFCGRVEPTVQTLAARYGSKVRFVWKDLPLDGHPDARPAALAAFAAGAQGKFWEMHDLLYAHQRSLGRKDLDGDARSLGLDAAAFDRDLDRAAGAARIADDGELARQLGVDGTPTFFVNGRPIVGALPIDAFVKIIDEELAH